jgi:hypothetical protein
MRDLVREMGNVASVVVVQIHVHVYPGPIQATRGARHTHGSNFTYGQILYLDRS